MTKQELIQKLSQLEWEDFEVKQASSSIPKSIWETVSAFSNTAGGWVVFGVEEEGAAFNITGVQNPAKLEQDFLNTLNGEKFNAKYFRKRNVSTLMIKLYSLFTSLFQLKNQFITTH